MLQLISFMARTLRVGYPGAVYHLMNRGDHREVIFRDDADRDRFVATLGDACLKTAWEVHALCLIPNHFHLVVDTPGANLVAGMKWLLGTYAGRFNRRHKLFGHLFSGRYKALVVDGSGDGYLKTVCDYVQLNPARAKFLAPEVPLRDYAWSNSSKRRPQEIRGGGAASGGNGRNRGVDRGAVAGGSPRVSQPLLYCQLY